MGLPFKAVAQAALDRSETLVPSWFPDGKREGDWWVCLNPNRDDKKPGSFKVNLIDGGWLDFAENTHKGGDLISLYAFKFNLLQEDACRELAREFGLEASAAQPTRRVATLVPVPREAPPAPSSRHQGEWVYRDAQGNPLKIVRRFNREGGGKEFRPLTFQAGRWEWKDLPEPRPLYGLDRLMDPLKSRVLIVEGEKAADAAARLFPALAVVTSGSSASAGKTDWTPLRGREVVLWPDHDEPGLKYAGAVHDKLKALGVHLRVVEVPKGWPEKWDLADAPPDGANPGTLQNMIDQAQTWASGQEDSRRLDVLTWADFKGKAVPSLEWLWEPFLPRISFGILASLPKHGKSILSLQLGVAVATGLPLFGYPTQGPAGVGVLALEDDRNVIHRRIIAIVESYGREWTAEHDRRLQGNLRILVRSRVALEALSAESQEFHLAGMAQELGEAMQSTVDAPALLFLDTLNAIHDGDENSATETRPLAAAIYSLNATLGCSVWPLHHLRKAGIGRNAPSLEERLNSELIRGSGALLASARGTCQFGWVLPTEAGKVGLEQVNCARRYAILCLTTVNDGPASPWLLLEHSERAGIWVPVHNGDQILASLRGGQAALELSKAEEILLDVAQGLKHRELAEKHYPEDPKADTKIKTQLNALRNRHRWIQKGSMELTVQGFSKVQELGAQQENPVHLPEVKDEHLPVSA